MNTRQQQGRSRHSRLWGMTLLELMIAMTLLTVIILGLYSMFDQTQKAMLRGAEEVDVQDTSRSAVRILLAELDQFQPVNEFGQTNMVLMANTNTTYLRQSLGVNAMGAPVDRVHRLQDLFLQVRDSRWRSVGYFVGVSSDPGRTPRAGESNMWAAGVGSLYRFELDTNILMNTDQALYKQYSNTVWEFRTFGPGGMSPTAVSRVQRVADGVCHLRMEVYTNNTLFGQTVNSNIARTNLVLTNMLTPSHFDVELGFLEPKLIQQSKAIPNSTIISNLLYRSAGNVLMFRQRVPVRTGFNQSL